MNITREQCATIMDALNDMEARLFTPTILQQTENAYEIFRRAKTTIRRTLLGIAEERTEGEAVKAECLSGCECQTEDNGDDPLQEVWMALAITACVMTLGFAVFFYKLLTL